MLKTHRWKLSVYFVRNLGFFSSLLASMLLQFRSSHPTNLLKLRFVFLIGYGKNGDDKAEINSRIFTLRQITLTTATLGLFSEADTCLSEQLVEKDLIYCFLSI